MRYLLIISLLWCNASNAQMMCNGWRFSAAPSLPTSGLWADWNATLGITQSANRISAWADQSGNGRNLAQATSGLQPLWNGTDIVTFSGSRGDNMDVAATIATAYTIYVVGSVNVTTNGDAAILAYDRLADGNLYMIVSRSSSVNKLVAYGNNFAVSITSSASVSNNTYSLLKAKYNGGSNNSYLTVNSTTTPGNLGTSTTLSPFNVGFIGTNTASWAGKRILVYQGTHDEAAVAAYLTATYGVP